MECLFCKIINKEIPCKSIYEDEIVLAFLDINPDSPGHTLIIPKKHYKDLTDIDEDTLNHILKIAKILKERIENILMCDGVILVQNNGHVQEIKHFHLHLKPYYKNKKNLSIDEVFEKLSL